MTAEELFAMAVRMEERGQTMAQEGFAVLGAYLREDARSLRDQAWSEVTR